MASMFSKWKHLTFPLLMLSTALLFLITNYLFFTINYTRHLQDEFQNVTTYLSSLQNHEWFEVVSREIMRDEKIKMGLANMDRIRGELHTRTGKNITAYLRSTRNPKWFEVVEREFKDEAINVGLVNIDEKIMDGIHANSKVVKVHFDPVGEDIRWSGLAPERIDENSKCPDIPMPRFEDYEQLDVVVARVPHSECEDGGSRNVFRLQVNLVVANLLVRSTRKNNMPVLAVFVESCDPMREIFRCDDLLWNTGNSWVYKPELTRISQIVLMPIGPCQFLPPFSHHGEEAWTKLKHIARQTNHHHQQPREAYITILHTSEDYVCGAIVLAQSIIQSNSTKDLILLADDNISPESIVGLRAAGWKTKRIRRIRSPYSRKDSYNEWNYSKLRIWQLKQLYDKLMFIDADLLVNRNLDEFFAYPELTAAGNYQKHFFNSGLMLVEPSQCTFDVLIKKMRVVESYNGGDQGFLNEMFAWWHRLPAQLNYLKVFVNPNDHLHWINNEVYAVHYTGLKPWKCFKQLDCNWDEETFHRYASSSAHRMWWRVYRAMPKKLRPYCPGSGGHGSKNSVNFSTTKGHPVVSIKGL
ncbi:UNVERIFIED_CONTAM: putative UDP-glucuronate:xylan alpha-glucuronosyltransferase 5 [Sesamum radiatum]|uniref:Hexosyltransferase n=1 Tax=Sesamum radiatum TaxID=300843 RepID=A0AAW2TKI3_SESRA